MKWGDEVHTETFAARLAWAAGYFVEVNYFVPSGRIEGAGTLQRAGECIAQDGGFQNARFELDEPGVVKHFDEHSWAWNDNPFVGTRELNGLKIVMMLLSNWDNKDVRDVARGSNTAIFEYRMERDVREARYLIIDWGAALGTWGSNVLSRGRWDCAALRGAERSVRARRGRRPRVVGLQRPANGRCRHRHQPQRRAMALQISGQADRRSARRRPEGQRRNRNARLPTSPRRCARGSIGCEDVTASAPARS